MFHRTKRSTVKVLCAWGVVIAGFSGPGTPTSALANALSIRFDKLEAYAQAESPPVRIFAQELVKLQAERDKALRWSNPELGYNHEEGANIREWQITLRKRLVMPFSQPQRKDGWADQVRSAEFRLDQATSNLLADLKTGYVHLRLLDAFLTHLDQLGDIVTEASTTAEARHSEGNLSGIESHLIQFAALSLDASRRNALQERGEIAALWYAEMGVSPGNSADLVTPVVFQPVELASSSEYVNLLEGRPGIQSQVALQRALGKQAAAAQPSLVPGIDVYAGFKRFEAENDGFVAGVALSLPVFDRNAAVARRHAAEQRIVENKLDLLRVRITGEIEALVNLIEDAQRVLSTIPVSLDHDPPVMINLLYSYQDGQLTLDVFLNAIQIEVNGLRDYYDQLNTYYRNIFRLEAITGSSIVSFER